MEPTAIYCATVRLPFHQRSSRGPTSMPIKVASNIPSEYHVRTKIADTSGQWMQ
jgi:hypothetical protein